MKDPLSIERKLCVVAFVVCAALNVWFSSHGWRNNILEGHEFRQAQTALTIQYLQQDGWSLAYPLPLFGPPWSAPMEFPLFQVCVAAFGKATGLAIEPAARLVSLAFFYLALPALFLLLRDFRVPPHRRWLFLAALLVSPLYLYYSRCVMIESTALCVCAWFLLAYVRTLGEGRAGWLTAAIGLGLVASLAKVTTYMVFLGVAAAYTLWLLADRWRQPAGRWPAIRQTIIRGLVATVPSVLVGVAWVRYSDAVKLSNPLSEFLTSGPLQAFTFGTLAQRLSPAYWWRIVEITGNSVLPPLLLSLILGFIVFAGRAYWNRVLLLLLGFAAGPLLFANLYFVHDYYSYATGLFLVGLLALGWSRLLDVPAVPTAVKWLVIALCLGLEVRAFTRSYNLFQIPPRPPAPELSRVLAAVTAPDDVVLIYGLEWNPVVPYFSGRRAIMVTNQYRLDHDRRNAVIGRLPPGRIAALVAYGDSRQYEDFLGLLARSLQLGDHPVLISSTAKIYLADRIAPNAASALATINAREFSLVTADPSVAALKRQHVVVAQLADQSLFDMMNPRPVEVVVPFGLSTGEVDGQRVFNAHAPTDVLFDVPAGAQSLETDFGVLPAAYESGPGPAGIRFRVELVSPAGVHAVLFEQYLNPRGEPADRGRHHATVSVPAGTTGRIVLSTLPGPSGNISYAWGYWTAVKLR